MMDTLAITKKDAYEKSEKEALQAIESRKDTLKHLYISSHFLVSKIIVLLPGFQNLASLSVCDTRLSLESIQTICRICTLKSLSLCPDVFVQEEIMDSVKCLSTLTELTSLDIHGNNIGSKGTVRMLASMKNLTKLVVDYCRLCDYDAVAISKLPKLTTLNISNNNLHSVGAIAISAMPTLTKLYISYNRIGAEGIQAIAFSMNRLKELDISRNGLIIQSVLLVMESLTQLQKLWVVQNAEDRVFLNEMFQCRFQSDIDIYHHVQKHISQTRRSYLEAVSALPRLRVEYECLTTCKNVLLEWLSHHSHESTFVVDISLDNAFALIVIEKILMMDTLLQIHVQEQYVVVDGSDMKTKYNET